VDRIAVIKESTKKITQILANKNIRVTHQGIEAYVAYSRSGEPTQVNIPNINEDASDELINAIQGFLDHEVAHILFTQPKWLKKAADEGFHAFCNIIEDTFIEKEMANRFYGSSYNLSNTRNFYKDNFLKPELEKLSNDDFEGLFGVLIVPLFRQYSGQGEFDEVLSQYRSVIEKVESIIGTDIAKMIDEVECTEDSYKVAKLIQERIESHLKQQEEQRQQERQKDSQSDAESEKSEDEESEGGSEESEDEKSEESGSEGSEDEESESESEKPESEESEGQESESEESEGESEESEGQEFEGESEESEGEESEGESEPNAKTESGEPGEAPSGSTKGNNDYDLSAALENLDKKGDFDKALEGAISKEATSVAMNSDYIAYTTDDDLHEKYKPKQDDCGEVKAMEDRVDHMLNVITREMERVIKAESRSQWIPGQRRGKLDNRALSSLAIGNTYPHLAKENVFKRKETRTSKDIACMIAIDCSGSMWGYGALDSKIQTAIDTGYAFSSVLERLGINHSVQGFTTKDAKRQHIKAAKEQLLGKGIFYSRVDSLYLPVFKDWDERLTQSAKHRMSDYPLHPDNLKFNVDGESLRVFARELAKQKESAKLMIVLSDGNPNVKRGNRNDCMEDTRKAVKQIEDSGINVVGVGIKDPSVSNYYKNHLVLDNVSDLPEVVMGELKKAILDAIH